jgi:uncharacterized membrane protein
VGAVVAWFQRTFLRGILLILPLAITFLLLRWLFSLMTGLTTPVTERLVRGAGAALPDGPLLDYVIPLIALCLTIGSVLAAGALAGNYVGKRAWGLVERLLLKLPLVRWFYGSARQLIDAFAAPGSGAFREVVFVEYPRRGVWCLGFVTSPAVGVPPGRADADSVYVFLPTTPIPTSGYTIVVPRSDAPAAGMTVDEGLKLIVSGGFIAPRTDPSRAAADGPAPVQAGRSAP